MCGLFRLVFESWYFVFLSFPTSLARFVPLDCLWLVTVEPAQVDSERERGEGERGRKGGREGGREDD